MPRWHSRFSLLVALALVAGAILGGHSLARSAGFPAIRSWVLVGAYQDSSIIGTQFTRCIGAFGPRPDSLRRQPRALSLRFLRDRVAEARLDFGGYRIYRMVGTSLADNAPDSSRAMLVRRFSLNPGSEMTWNFSRVDTVARDTTVTFDTLTTTPTLKIDTLVTVTPHPTYMQYICNGAVVHDSLLTFVDPDSSGNYVKVCRQREADGTCKKVSIGDSVLVLQAPPGPHDGFRTWYAITYEELNTSDNNYQDIFVADTLDGRARCTSPTDRTTCPNLNSKLRNVAGPAAPSSGPTANLETAHVVPNPYRGHDPWDSPGGHEVHFVALPKVAKIRIYTLAGDFVRELNHDSKSTSQPSDFEAWDLKSATGNLVASGIYLYRIDSANFTYQSRFIVIL